MIRVLRVFIFWLALLPLAAQPQSRVVVYFSPGSSCTAAIVREIAAAKSSIHVQAYSFTSQGIAKALVDAEKRGVKVIAILDASNRTKNYSAADFLAHEGIETYIDSQHSIAHNKIIIIDNAIVITGSFNFTKAADQKNAENLLVIPDSEIAAKYEQNWQLHFAHSEYYAGK
jgi:phosphatidylserine/phosphatidylglycerophosphate/cardiolipin synthase-like enzyme